MSTKFWEGKKVLITGHSGFKGAWLSLWLHILGADVTGYSLNPPTKPSLFELAAINHLVRNVNGDIRNYDLLNKTISNQRPDVVFHLAAQPLVRESYRNPVETYETNVMGTVNLLDSIRLTGCVRSVINITSDKCYENREWQWGYRENDRLGGYDPYSNSKACSELVTEAYRNSFFNRSNYQFHGVALATARAGNVIGGGDFATDRLIPDIIRSILHDEIMTFRNPKAVRPWQHVLEPIAGYLILAEKLYDNGVTFATSWNFGPDDNDAHTVEWIAQRLFSLLNTKANYCVAQSDECHEASWLKLDCSKAKNELGWHPVWNIQTAIEKIAEWIEVYKSSGDIQSFCKKQIFEYMRARDYDNAP